MDLETCFQAGIQHYGEGEGQSSSEVLQGLITFGSAERNEWKQFQQVLAKGVQQTSNPEAESRQGDAVRSECQTEQMRFEHGSPGQKYRCALRVREQFIDLSVNTYKMSHLRKPDYLFIESSYKSRLVGRGNHELPGDINNDNTVYDAEEENLIFHST